MLETIAAIIAVMFIPSLTVESGIIWRQILQFAIIVSIAMISNFIQSMRLCRTDANGAKRSISEVLGKSIMKGLACGFGAMLLSIVVLFIPALRIPFMVLSFIPDLESVVDGLILAIGYAASSGLAYPILGC